MFSDVNIDATRTNVSLSSMPQFTSIGILMLRFESVGSGIFGGTVKAKQPFVRMELVRQSATVRLSMKVDWTLPSALEVRATLKFVCPNKLVGRHVRIGIVPFSLADIKASNAKKHSPQVVLTTTTIEPSGFVKLAILP